MKLALLNLQKTPISILLTSTLLINGLFMYEDMPENATGHKQRKRVKITGSSTSITKADQKNYGSFHIMLLNIFQVNFHYV